MSLQKNKITRTFSQPDEFYSENIMTEYRQCIDEGLDAAPYKQLFEAVAAMPMSESREKAADMAFRDACVSHTKNGIYGEMYIAALLALCAVESDLMTAIKDALKLVPQKSRFVKCVSAIIEKYENGTSEDECFAGIHTEWNEHEGYDWCHTLSDIQIVVASLLYDGGDYTKTICRAVQTCFDADCNAAAAGSVLGMLKGFSAIDEKWYAPFNGKLETQLFGVGTADIESRVQRTMEDIAL